jgi:hypothetical protein
MIGMENCMTTDITTPIGWSEIRVLRFMIGGHVQDRGEQRLYPSFKGVWFITAGFQQFD